jgi:hypothetical protein
LEFVEEVERFKIHAKVMDFNLRIYFLLAILLHVENSAQGISVECKFQDLNWGDVIGTVYTCWLQPQTISGHQTITEVTGTHLTGRTNNDVKGINSYDGAFKCDRIPKNFNNFFPNIEAIYFVQSGLKMLTKEDLKQFPKLKILYVHYNDLESLDGDLFEFNTELEEIYFSNNKLKSIGSDLLKPLTKLIWAQFSGNPCTNTIMVPDVYNDKTGIEKLKKELIDKCSTSNEMSEAKKIKAELIGE